MQKITLFLFLLSILLSCRKVSTEQSHDPLPEKVKSFLREGLSEQDYSKLKLSNAIRLQYDSMGVTLWRVPYNEGNFEASFILVKTNLSEDPLLGKIIHVDQLHISNAKLNGLIEISSLNKQHVLVSTIKDGYITALHKTQLNTTTFYEKNQSPTPVVPASAGADVLPECIVVGYLNPETGEISSSVYIRMLDLLAETTSNPATGSNSSQGQGNTIYSTGNATIYSNTYTPLNPVANSSRPGLIRIDNEDNTENPPISLAAFIKCFSIIPDDANTSYSITIMSDIPVDEEPNDLFSFNTGSPGHAFLNITKQNGNQSMSQNIGFYPNGSFKSLINSSPVTSKFTDNQYHEFNASLKMSTSKEQFQIALNLLASFSSTKYDLDQFNCTDLALQVFNAGRSGPPLTIPLYHIPGSPISKSNTPQGLYFELNSMKITNDPDGKNISIGKTKLYAGPSHGPCN